MRCSSRGLAQALGVPPELTFPLCEFRRPVIDRRCGPGLFAVQRKKDLPRNTPGLDRGGRQVTLPTAPSSAAPSWRQGTTFESGNPATGALLRPGLDAGEGVDRAAMRGPGDPAPAFLELRAGVSERRATMLRSPTCSPTTPRSWPCWTPSTWAAGRRRPRPPAFSGQLFRATPRRSTRSATRSRPPPGTTALVRRVPLGVVGAVVPWNYRSTCFSPGRSRRPWPPATTWCSASAGSSRRPPPCIAELAAEAGIPDRVLNVLVQTSPAGPPASPDVDVLAFTGSTEVGFAPSRSTPGSPTSRWFRGGAAKSAPGR